MSNTTIGTFVLEGDGQSFIADNSARKESMLTPLPLYLLDSDGTDVFDYGGVVKTFSLNGIFVAVSVANAKTFIDNMESLIQGKQDVAHGYPLVFTDDFRGTKYVKIMDCETNKVAGEPLLVRWSIKLVESSTNA